MAECLGMVEVRGYLAAVAVADAALKSANVNLSSSQKIKGGITTIFLSGDVGAVQAAVDAAAIVAKDIGAYRSHHVIPRPDMQIDQCFIQNQKTPSTNENSEIKEENLAEEKTQSVAGLEKVNPQKSELEAMKVVDLRKLALKEKDFSLNSKEIKYANKAQLIEAFEKLKTKGGES